MESSLDGIDRFDLCHIPFQSSCSSKKGMALSRISLSPVRITIISLAGLKVVLNIEVMRLKVWIYRERWSEGDGSVC